MSAAVMSEHDKISPTAKLVAYLRTFTGIPYSAEIAESCNAEVAFKEIVGHNAHEFLWLAPLIELRYKSVDEALRLYFEHTQSLPNILELASGVSPRGLIWSKQRSVTYIETDLDSILSEKIAITMSILEGKHRKNLRWQYLNAVDDVQFERVEKLLAPGPLVIICEGLLPYLSLEEKGKLAKNIHKLLRKRGGVWITPDISSSDRLKELAMLDPHIGQVLASISSRTGRNLQSYSFDSLAKAEQFFGDRFVLTKWDQAQLVPQLDSLLKVEVDQRILAAMKERGKIWYLEAR